jgi:hypothetical protein
MIDYGGLIDYGSGLRLEGHSKAPSVISTTFRHTEGKTSSGHHEIGPASRIHWLRVVLAAAFLCGLLLSWKLWITSRSYPLTPVFDSLPTIHSPFDYIVFVALLLLLPTIMISSRPRRYALTFVVLAALLSLWDQSRWQPWFYQYIFMLAPLGCYSLEDSDPNAQNAALNMCRFIVASTYVWSGIQKINLSFVGGIFPWLIKPLLRALPAALATFALPAGVVAPILEIGIGVGLLTKRLRTVSIALAVAMHALILLSIGPLGHNWNSVVWPWNVSMPLFVLVLFWRVRDLSLKDLTAARFLPLSSVVAVLFGVMPLFSFFGLWDSYLSAALYSGNITQAAIYMSDSVKTSLPGEVQRYASKLPGNDHLLNISGWSFGELNVPPYPEKRIYRNIARRMCAYAQEPFEVSLEVRERPSPISRNRTVTSHDCSDLK